MSLERMIRLCLAWPILMAVQACAAAQAPLHEIVQGTDGNFAVTVRAEGPAQVCRTEAMRAAREELTRRRLSPALAQETYLQSSETTERGRGVCAAELPVSTLPPWR